MKKLFLILSFVFVFSACTANGKDIGENTQPTPTPYVDYTKDKPAFENKLKEIGYTQSMIEEFEGFYYQNPQDKVSFLLSYGKERTGEEKGTITEIASPDGGYTLREVAVSWGGEGVNNAVFLDNNNTGATSVINENYWNSSHTNKPQFVTEESFLCFNNNRVGLFNAADTVNPVNIFENPHTEKLRVQTAYYDVRNDIIVVAYCDVTKVRENYESATDYYKFVIADKKGNVIKEMDSQLGVAYTVAGIAAPDFADFDVQHPDGKLYLRLWKYGMFRVDLETGETEKFEW